MSPIFNFHRKYPKALKDLARETERLADAEEDIARTMLGMMRDEDNREATKTGRPTINVTPTNSKQPKGKSP